MTALAVLLTLEVLVLVLVLRKDDMASGDEAECSGVGARPLRPSSEFKEVAQDINPKVVHAQENKKFREKGKDIVSGVRECKIEQSRMS